MRLTQVILKRAYMLAVRGRIAGTIAPFGVELCACIRQLLCRAGEFRSRACGELSQFGLLSLREQPVKRGARGSVESKVVEDVRRIAKRLGKLRMLPCNVVAV